MNKIISIIFSAAFLFLAFAITPAYADDSCSGQYGIEFVPKTPTTFTEGTVSSFDFSVKSLPPGSYVLNIELKRDNLQKEWIYDQPFTVDSSGTASFTLSDPELLRYISSINTYYYYIWVEGNVNNDGETKTCNLGYYKVTKDTTNDCDVSIKQGKWTDSQCIEKASPLDFTVTNIRYKGKTYDGRIYVSMMEGPLMHKANASAESSGGTATGSFPSVEDAGSYNIVVTHGLYRDVILCETAKVSIKSSCTEEEREAKVSFTMTQFDLCKGVSGSECSTCIGSDGVWTALGCIHFQPKRFIEDFLKIALGIAGGIALLLMVYGAFLISGSAGDPKKADEGKEVITGTIAGLLFIVFSVFLLKLIGVEILDIPGF